MTCPLRWRLKGRHLLNFVEHVTHLGGPSPQTPGNRVGRKNVSD